MGHAAEEKMRLAIVVSHPIQHFAPFYRELAKEPEVDLKVFFCSRIGLEKYFDVGFGMEVAWDNDLLNGYEHEFLPGAESIRQTTFRDVNNPEVGKRLEPFHPDVIVVLGYSMKTNLRVLYWAWRHSVPVLMFGDSELLQPRRLMVRLFKEAYVRAVYRFVSGFLSIGDHNEKYLRYYGAPQQRIFRSPYPTDERMFMDALSRRDELRRQVRSQWKIPEGAFVGIFVGKLIRRKRPGDLVEAAGLLGRQNSGGRPFVAMLAGDGELRQQLESRSASQGPEHCRFIGFASQKELRAAYCAADICVHPADIDPHPIAVNEAVLMGMPVVVTDRIGSVGPTDTARSGENALVYPAGNVEALAREIDTLRCNPELYSKMSAMSRVVAGETGMRASVEGYLRAMRYVVKGFRGGRG